ncbi:LytR/AlgR family response regulator transcription factor [Sphingobacterium sp. HJSM2_6]|uniref:LytR/AlgR family response regulator transcription factor n=1 Tax=Sphingobacterium sp. HJSM2_6 TaxID=3366264 RepID=UPI003BC3A768
MRSYKTIIIEDEKPAARLLHRKLTLLGFQDVDLLHSVAQAKKWFETHEAPALIFMDIQLSDGLSFDIFEELEIETNIIFITAYDEYTLKAFKLNSVDYLLKPILDDELQFAVEKFEKFNNPLPTQALLDKKTMLFPNQLPYKSRFTVKIGLQIKLIDCDEVECFYAQNKGNYLFTKNKEEYLIDYSLEKLETVLDPRLFFRISRNYIIQVKAIKNINIHSATRLKITLNHCPFNNIIVSRDRVSIFKNWLD